MKRRDRVGVLLMVVHTHHRWHGVHATTKDCGSLLRESGDNRTTRRSLKLAVYHTGFQVTAASTVTRPTCARGADSDALPPTVRLPGRADPTVRYSRSCHADGSRPPNMIANTTTIVPSSR